MPKYRKLYVKTTESLDINDMPDDFTRLLWVLLPLGLCREGRGIDSSAWIRSKTFPLREDIHNGTISDAMDWFAERSMIERYEAEGRKYFYIPTFHDYQGNTTKEAKSNYPPPETASQELVKSKSIVSKTPPEKKDKIPILNIESESTSESINSEVDSIFDSWCDLLPDKPKPKRTTKSYIAKIKIRIKDDHFRDNWREAMIRASQSPHLQSSSWFNFSWFIKNDENWQKCLDRYYASFDEQHHAEKANQRDIKVQSDGSINV